MLTERDAELQREQLVELQPLPSASELPRIVGEVDPAHRVVVAPERLGFNQPGRQRVGDRRQLLERAMDELPDRPGGDPV